MRFLRLDSAVPIAVNAVMLAALLAALPVRAHVVLVDPVARTDDTNLTEPPCGAKPPGLSVATYPAGAEIEITAEVIARHNSTLQAFISFDNFASRIELAKITIDDEGIHKMTATLPPHMVGPAVLQVVHDMYMSCADITVSDGTPFTINPGLNDAWFSDATAGQGFFIIVFADTGLIFLAWFTFDTERPPGDVTAFLGEPGHRWLTAQGPYLDDTATLGVYLTEGGVFDMPEPGAETGKEPIGFIRIYWSDCENGTLTYDIPGLGLMGRIAIRRIVPDNVALCEALG